MPTSLERIQQACSALQRGELIILTDHPDRENEGDLVAPAETITPEQMNFMIHHGGGIVCLPMTAERLTELELPLMVPEDKNTSNYSTPFTVSIDAREGIATGVSAVDRTRTIHAAINPATRPSDLVRPGHVFPLQAKSDGVIERQGHTEGSTDIVRIAGFKPAAVISEIMNPDGSMAIGNQLLAFAKTHRLTMLSIDDILEYRLLHEDRIEEEAHANIPLEQYGLFHVTAIREKATGVEHLVLSMPYENTEQAPLVRIHSACATGDVFASHRCDCNKQLHHALERISKEGGILIYLNQEGRGIGLFNKIKAYALQESGLDTVEANIQLGLPVDSRNYAIAANILRNRQIKQVRLLTNNPNKVNDLKKYGIPDVERIMLPSFYNQHNHHYLKTKQTKMNHDIQMDAMNEFKRIIK